MVKENLNEIILIGISYIGLLSITAMLAYSGILSENINYVKYSHYAILLYSVVRIIYTQKDNTNKANGIFVSIIWLSFIGAGAYFIMSSGFTIDSLKLTGLFLLIGVSSYAFIVHVNRWQEERKVATLEFFKSIAYQINPGLLEKTIEHETLLIEHEHRKLDLLERRAHIKKGNLKEIDVTPKEQIGNTDKKEPNEPKERKSKFEHLSEDNYEAIEYYILSSSNTWFERFGTHDIKLSDPEHNEFFKDLIVRYNKGYKLKNHPAAEYNHFVHALKRLREKD